MHSTTVFRPLIALCAVAIFSAQAYSADLIGYWNFNDLSIATASPPGSGGVPTSIPATTGAGTLSLTGFAGNVDDFTGTSVNSIPVNTPGEESLSLLPGTGLVGNGGFLEFSFSMAGRTNFGVSYATQGTSSGFNSNQWSYSTDGVSFTNFGPVITPATAYSLTGPLITTALDGAATAFVRYTLTGGTGATGNNRLDNIRLEHNATAAPPPNPVSLPEPGDIVLGLNNSSTANTLEIARGPDTPSGGVRYPGPWSGPNFIQSVEFDNLAGQSHNVNGNLLGVNFAVGGGTNSGGIYSFGTRSNSPPAGQLIGNTCSTCSAALGGASIGHTGTLTVTNLAGLSVSPDNSKIAVVGEDTGAVIVYDYTAGDTMGAGASLTGGRQSATGGAVLVTASTQGTAWRDNSTVIGFASSGDIVEVDAATMAHTYKNTVTTNAVVGTPFIGSNYSAIAYNPDISPYVYTLYSGFAAGSSVTHLYVLDPASNYSQLTDVTLSGSSQTGREIALDEDGNLFISGFDSTVTYIPASNFASPAAIAAIADNSSIFWYQSTAAATSFVGMDIGHGEAATQDGDHNGDGTVNTADYVTWRKNPGGFGGDPGGYDAFKGNFGEGGAGGGGAVPEPASITMLLLGVAALAFRRRAA